jgi:hypothetical protein
MVIAVRNLPARRSSTLARITGVTSALATLGAAATLAGCGSTINHATGEEASADVGDATTSSCAATALDALGHVAARIYHEGVSSERTISALHAVEGSAPLRLAVEAGDASSVSNAAQALVAAGHMTDLQVTRAGKVLAEVGGAAVAPLTGTLKNAAGKPIASFATSVWADSGVIAETSGVAEGTTVLRTQERSGSGHTIAGAFDLPTGELAAQGTLTHGGTAYQYSSFPAEAYPSGQPLREYVLRTVGSLARLCGASADDTTANTLSRIARLIYDGESGGRTLPQIRRVQSNQPLLEAVARRDPRATHAAIEALLTQHIVRLRVTVGGRLLSDVGGPYVLAPVSAPLRLGGRTIGSLTLSIQDDEGYKRLAARLAGLDSVMYMGSQLVKSTIGVSPGAVPTRGAFSYRGKDYRAYTLYAKAFPSGPLRITVLIPIPYS